MHRKRIEELVGDEQERAGGHFGKVGMPAYRDVGEALFLDRTQTLASLDEMDTHARVKSRDTPRCPQDVGEQSGAPRTELDQTKRRRLPQVQPGAGEPGAEHLAERLTDLRRRDEVAARSQRIAGAIIAVGRMVQGESHEPGYRERPVAPDLRCQRPLKTARGWHAPVRSCA
jgi:hypothetical protein